MEKQTTFITKTKCSTMKSPDDTEAIIKPTPIVFLKSTEEIKIQTPLV